ncbi:hypothetical protein [Spirochaeta thermophila]|uniref:hypothetical protein n=1 Tax=Winmispira thermophila TaxID=154 RepID=UPI0005A2812A|nr:hypothetical protein [Spirochaeta thermophila]
MSRRVIHRSVLFLLLSGVLLLGGGCPTGTTDEEHPSPSPSPKSGVVLGPQELYELFSPASSRVQDYSVDDTEGAFRMTSSSTDMWAEFVWSTPADWSSYSQIDITYKSTVNLTLFLQDQADIFLSEQGWGGILSSNDYTTVTASLTNW